MMCGSKPAARRNGSMLRTAMRVLGRGLPEFDSSTKPILIRVIGASPRDRRWHLPTPDGWFPGDSPGASLRHAGCRATRQRCFGGAFPADVALVRPHVAPVAIATAVADLDVVEIAVDGLQCGRALEVEDDVRVA